MLCLARLHDNDRIIRDACEDKLSTVIDILNTSPADELPSTVSVSLNSTYMISPSAKYSNMLGQYVGQGSRGHCVLAKV